jgi:hypothetical protein
VTSRLGTGKSFKLFYSAGWKTRKKQDWSPDGDRADERDRNIYCRGPDDDRVDNGRKDD